jgi:hypothetical protein
MQRHLSAECCKHTHTVVIHEKEKKKKKKQKKKVAHLVLISPAAMQVERESCLPMHSKQGAETRVKTTTTTTTKGALGICPLIKGNM